MFHGKAYANNDTGALKHSYLLVQTKGKYQFETDIPSHVKNALPLVGDGYQVPVLCIEILCQVQVVRIGDIREVGTIHKKRTNQPSRFRVYKIGTQAGIDQQVACGRDLRIQGTIDIVLLPVFCKTKFEIGPL